VEAARPAVEAGLLKVGDHVEFAHPLVRSAAYRSAADGDRHRVHRALAAATDPETDPDRRAWHRARATAGPDEEVAAELQLSAGRARSRGGLAAAAAFLQRAVALTRDPALRADRALSAAQMSLQAGEFDAALDLLATSESEALDEAQVAQVQLLRGQVAFASSTEGAGSPLLLGAAKRLEPVDAGLAREAYLDAWGAAMLAGRFATVGDLHEVSRAARSAPSPTGKQRASDLLLDGLAMLVTEGAAASAEMLRRATKAFVDDPPPMPENFRWGWMTTIPPNVLWDEDSWHAITTRQVQEARDAGALARLPIDLNASAGIAAWRGDFEAAAAAIDEAESITDATGTRFAPYAGVLLAALRGREDDASPMIESMVRGAAAGRQGIGLQWVEWVNAVLFNGLGRYWRALASAQRAVEEMPQLFVSAWAIPELIEAAVRSGKGDLGATALETLSEVTTAAGTAWGLGIQARSRALLSDGPAADELYREAIHLLGRTRLRPEVARAHLLYGEWLRRQGRRIDARDELRTAHDMLVEIGMEAFAERARRELIATGEKVRKRSEDTRYQLTAQEGQIARLAREGLSNPEIGTQLFISARTVEWHMHKVFAKLGISSRRQLWAALPEEGRLVGRP
jgi:DNA-binding CsgD family transcriptional regulator